MLEDSLRVERNEGRGTEEELVRFRDKDAKYAKVAFVSPTDGQVHTYSRLSYKIVK